MDNVISFVRDNYIYVAAVGLVLIIILIGFLSSSHKRGKKTDENNDQEKMVNLNDVHTGEINQVADTIKQNEMKPVNAPMPTTDALKVDQDPVVPVAGEVKSPEPETIPDNTNLEKTEIMDFSDLNSSANIPQQPVNNQATFVPNTPQDASNEGSILNGEETVQSEDNPSNNPNV